MRGATMPNNGAVAGEIFQSTRPMRGATSSQVATETATEIDFNPRAPCGARRLMTTMKMKTRRFQSTRPMRGATSFTSFYLTSRSISIHAPHAGRDFLHSRWFRRQPHFNPRAPCGARPPSGWFNYSIVHFNPRAPCGARQTAQ